MKTEKTMHPSQKSKSKHLTSLLALALCAAMVMMTLSGCSSGGSSSSESSADESSSEASSSSESSTDESSSEESSADESSSESSASAESSSGKVMLKILDTEYVTEEYAIAIKKGNTELYDKINTALNELIDDGTVQQVIDKYISGVENDLVFQQDTEGKEELIMGTNAAFPPYEYYENDTIVGIDAEIAAAIADKLDMKLVIEDMEFGALLAALSSDKIDMAMAGMTVTEERKTQVDFTDSYTTAVQVVIVPEDSEITSVDMLFEDGHDWVVGVQSDTTGDIYTTSDIEDKGYGTIERYNTGADAVQALVSGKVDCVVIDSEPAKAFVEANNN